MVLIRGSGFGSGSATLPKSSKIIARIKIKVRSFFYFRGFVFLFMSGALPDAEN